LEWRNALQTDLNQLVVEDFSCKNALFWAFGVIAGWRFDCDYRMCGSNDGSSSCSSGHNVQEIRNADHIMDQAAERGE
jgi:hypothetical protein